MDPAIGQIAIDIVLDAVGSGCHVIGHRWGRICRGREKGADRNAAGEGREADQEIIVLMTVGPIMAMMPLIVPTMMVAVAVPVPVVVTISVLVMMLMAIVLEVMPIVAMAFVSIAVSGRRRQSGACQA